MSKKYAVTAAIEVPFGEFALGTIKVENIG